MKLYSNRLIINYYTKKDFNDFKAILMNDEVMKHISGKGNSKKVTQEKFNTALETNAKNTGLGFFNVTLIESKELVGFAKLVDFDNKYIEVGYALLKKHWGFGYASEITQELVKYGKKYFPKKQIMAIVNLGNQASKKVLLKQGFSLYKVDDFKGEPVEFYKLN